MPQLIQIRAAFLDSSRQYFTNAETTLSTRCETGSTTCTFNESLAVSEKEDD